ncbi:MAG: alpha/beta hydrolase [Meiothermus silvanus]|nr:alpha/beta hydrolase [Allomeiothermus silvanus]
MARDVWLEVGGIRTFARVLGSGPPLVLVPGLACSHLYFGPVQRALAEHFEVWAYDPPGHGYSRAPVGAYTKLGELSDHLAAWLEAAQLAEVVLFGHSQGAEIAVDLAARRPHLVSSLVLCAPTGIPEYPSIAGQILNLARDALREPASLAPLVLQSYLRAGTYRAWRLLCDQLHHQSVPNLHRIKAPVLLVTGSRDPIIRPRLAAVMAEIVPDSRWIEVQGGAHAVHYSHAARVAAVVQQFVSQTESG